jgi:hypothetical protein
MKFNSHPYLLANFVSHGRTTPDYALDCTKIYGQFAMHVPLLLKKGDFSLNLLDNLNIVNNHLIDLTQNQFSYNQCAWGINIKSKLKNDIQENLPSMLLNYHEADNSGKTLDSRITQVYSLLNQQGELVNNSESAYIENVNFWVSEEQVILKFYYSTLHYTLDQIKQIVSATRAELLDQINL